MIIGNGAWWTHRPKGELITGGTCAKADDDVCHKRDFVKTICDSGTAACNVEIGHVASELIYLGNIALRTDQKLHFDPKTDQFLDNEKANGLLGRTY